MDHYSYRNLRDPLDTSAHAHAEPVYELCCEWLPTRRVLGITGTPTLIYSQATIVDRFYAYAEAYAPLRPMVCWSTACCHELEVMRTLLGRGAGFEVASGDDLERAWLAGASASRVLYSGLGKNDDEVRAALDGLYSPLYSMGVLVDNKAPYYRGPVGAFIAEDEPDLERIAALATSQRITCRVLLRRAGHEAFGFTDEQIREVLGSQESRRSVRVTGVATQPAEPGGTRRDPADLGGLVRLLRGLRESGMRLERLHLARGFDGPGRWPVEDAVATARLVRPVRLETEAHGLEISLTAPRSLVGQSAVLLTRVLAQTDTGAAPDTGAAESGAHAGAPRSQRVRSRVLVDQPLGLEGVARTGTLFVWPNDLGPQHRPGFGVPVPAMPGLVRTEIATAGTPTFQTSDKRPVFQTDMPACARGDVLAIFHDRLPDLASRHGASGTAAGRGIARVLVSNDRARLLARRLTIADTVARDSESVDLGL